MTSNSLLRALEEHLEELVMNAPSKPVHKQIKLIRTHVCTNCYFSFESKYQGESPLCRWCYTKAKTLIKDKSPKPLQCQYCHAGQMKFSDKFGNLVPDSQYEIINEQVVCSSTTCKLLAIRKAMGTSIHGFS